jgi:hypothetical protein
MKMAPRSKVGFRRNQTILAQASEGQGVTPYCPLATSSLTANKICQGFQLLMLNQRTLCLE